MIRKTVVVLTVLAAALCLINGARAEQTTVGGHLKLTLYDRPTGTHNSEQTSNYVGFSVRAFYIFVSHQLTDKVSIEVQPEFAASTGATPKFGSPIAKKTDPSTIAPEFSGFNRAQMTVTLPKEYEISFGIVKPRMSWDYGAELFWEDQMNGGKFTLSDISAVHDTGIELYKNFEAGKISLPTYVYVLNGGYEFNDNNNQPAVLATVEPELGAFKLKGSFYYGKYDKLAKLASVKYLGGVAFEKGPLAIRAEGGMGLWENRVSSMARDSSITLSDGKPKGFYAKAYYRIFPWCRAMIQYDYMSNNNSGWAPGSEKYTTISPALQFSVANSSTLMLQYDIADWKRVKGVKEDLIKFNRLSVGWRTTF
jgi:hypothetical protein